MLAPARPSWFSEGSAGAPVSQHPFSNQPSLWPQDPPPRLGSLRKAPAPSSTASPTSMTSPPTTNTVPVSPPPSSPGMDGDQGVSEDGGHPTPGLQGGGPAPGESERAPFFSLRIYTPLPGDLHSQRERMASVGWVFSECNEYGRLHSSMDVEVGARALSLTNPSHTSHCIY